MPRSGDRNGRQHRSAVGELERGGGKVGIDVIDRHHGEFAFCLKRMNVHTNSAAKSRAEIIRVAFVSVELKETALVARYEVVGIARFGQGQQVIVIGIGRTLHARQRINVLGELPNQVEQAAGYGV